MKRLHDRPLSIRGILSLAASFVVAAFSLASPQLSWSQTTPTSSSPCAWPLQVTGHGLSNVAFPDTNATYWAMPVDTTAWQSAILTGQYAQSRFFSFTTYYDIKQSSPRVVAAIVDADITPDRGSSNPFAPITAAAPHNYTVTFDANTTGSANHVTWAPAQTTYIVYRIYVANKGLSREAGASLPNLTLVDANGQQHPLTQCSRGTRVQAEAKLLLGILQSGITARTCPETTPPAGSVTFTLSSGEGGIFPNPVTKYYAARHLCLAPGQVIVIRGRAADFPDTFNGETIYQPALPGNIQLRYWSLCNNKETTQEPVVACAADHDTALDAQGFYTYVISHAQAAGADRTPEWLPAGATWLPFGDSAIESSLAFRDMLPANGFTLTGAYLPTGVYCDRSTLIWQGWQGCFTAADVTPP